MEDYLKNSIVRRCSSSLKIGELLKEIGAMSGKRELAQVFDPSRVINSMHLVGAYANAAEAFRSKTNISKSIGVEMLLFAAMTTQINVAIELMGAKTNSDFIMFSSSKAIYNRVKRLLGNERAFAPSRSSQIRVAKSFGITQEKRLDEFMLQKIAVSRLEG